MRRDIVPAGADSLSYEIREIVVIAEKLEKLGLKLTYENIGDPIAKGEKVVPWIKEEIKNPEFKLKEKVKLGMLPKYELLKNQKTSEVVGEGDLVLTHEGLTYDGTRDGQPFTFFIPSSNLPTYGMCTDVSRFYSFYEGEFVEFYPEHNVVEKFFLATEEIHRANGGKWQDFKFNK